MSSAPTGPQPSDRAIQSIGQEGSASADQVRDGVLLEKVVRQTLAAAESPAAVNPLDLQRLKAVAHRRRGQALAQEPVAVELVRAMLGPEFAGLDRTPDRYLAMSAQVAKTLLADPSSRERLERLWQRLCEM
jgi:hypothetical protein